MYIYIQIYGLTSTPVGEIPHVCCPRHFRSDQCTPPKLSTKSVESLGAAARKRSPNLGPAESCTHAMEQEVARQFFAHEPS